MGDAEAFFNKPSPFQKAAEEEARAALAKAEDAIAAAAKDGSSFLGDILGVGSNANTDQVTDGVDTAEGQDSTEEVKMMSNSRCCFVNCVLLIDEGIFVRYGSYVSARLFPEYCFILN